MGNWKDIVIAITIPQTFGFIGSCKSHVSIETWYPIIKKPSFTPPNWLFAPVWGTLYSSIGYASYLVWRDGGGFHGEASTALQVYGANLVFVSAWSPIFFGTRRIGLAAIDCIPLWGTALACVKLFGSINETAGKLMLPYLGWISYTTVLTFSMWYLNKDKRSK